MTGINWMTQGIIILLLAGHMPGAKERIFIPLRRKGGYLLHALAQLFTVRRFLRKSDILMKSILHIWKILMWAIVPESLDMRTGMCQLHWSIM